MCVKTLTDQTDEPCRRSGRAHADLLSAIRRMIVDIAIRERGRGQTVYIVLHCGIAAAITPPFRSALPWTLTWNPPSPALVPDCCVTPARSLFILSWLKCPTRWTVRFQGGVCRLLKDERPYYAFDHVA